MIVSLENPSNSWLWAILKELVVAHHDKLFRTWFQNLSSITFSNCAWGGERPKSTRWLSTPGIFDRLSKGCPGVSESHVDKPYVAVRDGNRLHFSTSEEAEYPLPLCVAAIEAIAVALKYPANMAAPSLKSQAMASRVCIVCDYVSCAFGATQTSGTSLQIGGSERERPNTLWQDMAFIILNLNSSRRV